MDDCLNLLNIKSKNPSLTEIKKSFRKSALKNHPDKGGNEEDFKKNNQAYETLLKNFVKSDLNRPFNEPVYDYKSFFSKKEDKKGEKDSSKQYETSQEIRKRQKRCEKKNEDWEEV